ncbi:MAG: porin family protein [Alphaproteobacteria bacterium]|nr:porin family protein [Alphaproteobacteria bacterium]
MKRTLLIACSALAISATAAVAADPMAPSYYDWNGFYVGLNAGYGFGGNDTVGFTVVPGGPGGNVGDLDISGFAGGLQLGYNYQMDSFLLGIVGDVQIGDIDDSFASVSAVPPVGTFDGSSQVDFFGTLRGRAGFTADRVLFYGTGGLAWAHNDYEVNGVDPGGNNVSINDSFTKLGWTVGGGAEFAVDDSMTVGMEYLYVHLGAKTLSGDILNAGGGNTGFDAVTVASPSFHTIRASLNWKF